MAEERFRIQVPGKGEVSAAFGPAEPAPAPTATVVVAHGAGAGMDHPFLVGFTRACNELGLATLRFNFPYMEAGRRSTDTPAVAIATWLAARDAAAARSGDAPIWASGKSYGGRMASMAVAEGMAVAGLVFLGYPLHPPANPDRVRAEHLATILVPMLFLRGTRDPFARADRLEPVLRELGDRAVHVPIEGGGHSFERSRKDDPREVGASLAPLVARFIREHS
jgi:predicted alpha/beta-hydrolase family hydrolase